MYKASRQGRGEGLHVRGVNQHFCRQDERSSQRYLKGKGVLGVMRKEGGLRVKPQNFSESHALYFGNIF